MSSKFELGVEGNTITFNSLMTAIREFEKRFPCKRKKTFVAELPCKTLVEVRRLKERDFKTSERLDVYVSHNLTQSIATIKMNEVS